MNATNCTGFVVVVDDEEDTRELLRELLEARGYQVATAQDGVEALDVVGNLPRVCLMILDLLMPRMDGNEVLQRLSTKGASQFPVWVSTSVPDRAPAGVPCLPKPVDVGRLLTLVDEHCAAESSCA